jgi:hypothetical protein
VGKGTVFVPAAHGSRAKNFIDPGGVEWFGAFRAGVNYKDIITVLLTFAF